MLGALLRPQQDAQEGLPAGNACRLLHFLGDPIFSGFCPVRHIQLRQHFVIFAPTLLAQILRLLHFGFFSLLSLLLSLPLSASSRFLPAKTASRVQALCFVSSH